MKNLISKLRFADKDIEQFIGLQLRYGVITSSLVVLIGGLFYLSQSGQLPLPSYHQFIGTKVGYTSLGQILVGVRHFQAPAIIQLGVVILIATPILRIAFSLLGFVLEKDKMYILITTIVLTVMLASIFGGLKI
ncbi:putative membrane protein [Mucilaginibacter gracilis]|uniref:Putative membrane protein n=1 Tax=Mucilaginibacter gracilis TaxID=423350 RepID=A0A495IWE8_9SPHI|nr:DUF1634 domain-containing protein [Mucilaginibacter gracilis]RKR80354.1 putative membrane protein [Mucilaginibacter gracilis]